MLRQLVAAISVLALFTTTVQAAALTNIQGQVFVNTGQGFKPAEPAMAVKPGDRIMTVQGGTVQIVYSASCTASVAADTVVIVEANPPCAPTTTGQADPAKPTSTGSNVLIIGGLVVGGGAIAALALGNGGGSKPASP